MATNRHPLVWRIAFLIWGYSGPVMTRLHKQALRENEARG